MNLEQRLRRYGDDLDRAADAAMAAHAARRLTASPQSPVRQRPRRMRWVVPSLAAALAVAVVGLVTLSRSPSLQVGLAPRSTAFAASQSPSPSVPQVSPPPLVTSRGSTLTVRHPVCPTYRVNEQLPLRLCDTGPKVRELQTSLNRHGARLNVDGYLGPSTNRAVLDFQRSSGLAPDGLVGTATWRALTGG